MRCPDCGSRAVKLRLDVYMCQNDRKVWMIHRFKDEEDRRRVEGL